MKAHEKFKFCNLLRSIKNLICLIDKRQLCRYLVQRRFLEYLSVRQEKQSRTGLRTNIIVPGEIFKVIDMASFCRQTM